MEDWGVTSSNEDSVFYNENMSILDQNRALNIAHELGHIWFGDLVTTSSWSEFWLNEGFARFMDLKSQDLYKEQEGKTASLSATLHKALWRDDDLTTKPLSWEMTKPSDAYEILNTINYEKGGSVLRMVEDLIGESQMKEVIQAYVKKHQYKNVVAQDFINVLQDFVSFNCTEFLLGFIKQPGYPLVTVENLNNEAHVILSQKRFLRWGQSSKEEKWSIPIKYLTNLDKTHHLTWFNSLEDYSILKFPAEIKWIKLNLNQTAYYRTNYPKQMWMEFTKIIKDFDLGDRIHLLDDSMALVRSGDLDCGFALNLTEYLKDEEQYEAWLVAQNNFGEIRRGLLQQDMDITYLKKYIAELIDKQYQRANWTVQPNETFRRKHTRATIINLACFYEHQGCREKVAELWNKQKTLPIDIKDIVQRNDLNKTINYNATSSNDYITESEWFGADLSQLNIEPTFKWPINIIESCSKWLKTSQKH